MMLDLYKVGKYAEMFEPDIMTQPDDRSQYDDCIDVYEKWLKKLDVGSVVELGSGQGYLADMFGPDVRKLKISMGKEQGTAYDDMNTPQIEDKMFDLVIARHSLEHSLMPVIMLSEMKRIGVKYLLVITPICNETSTKLINHYSVFNDLGWRGLFHLLKLTITAFEETPKEYRYLLAI